MDYRNTPAGPVRVQSMWIYIGLSIITLGVYAYFSMYRHIKTMRDFGEATNDDELKKIDPAAYYIIGFIVFAALGALVVWWLYAPTCILGGFLFLIVQRIQRSVTGKPSSTGHIIWSILAPFLAIPILMNRVWRNYPVITAGQVVQAPQPPKTRPF